MPETSTISKIVVHHTGQSTGILDNEKKQAIAELKDHGLFKPLYYKNGPYSIDLSIEENRLVFRLVDKDGQEIPSLVLSLKPYSRLIKDYFMMIESHETMRNAGQMNKLETIDMARRSIHNEGAELLIERLGDKISMDHETARLFFTLICALHTDQARLWR